MSAVFNQTTIIIGDVGNTESDTEIPGSLVSEPKHRDSRSKSRLGIGLGTDFKLKGDSESVSEPKL